MTAPTRWRRRLPCPLGDLILIADADALVALHLPGRDAAAPTDVVEDLACPHPVLDAAAHQLDEYFAGRRRVFELPLRADGTAFQQAVWAALRAIPFGATRSYGELAAALGRPSAARAIGAANGQNPIAIIVPCHRVIGADGSLTGFGGGLPAKRWLLAHESPQRALL